MVDDAMKIQEILAPLPIKNLQDTDTALTEVPSSGSECDDEGNHIWKKAKELEAVVPR